MNGAASASGIRPVKPKPKPKPKGTDLPTLFFGSSGPTGSVPFMDPYGPQTTNTKTRKTTAPDPNFVKQGVQAVGKKIADAVPNFSGTLTAIEDMFGMVLVLFVLGALGWLVGLFRRR